MSANDRRELIAKLQGATTLPDWAQTPINPAEARTLLRLIAERDLPSCPYVEWGAKVRLCSLPIGHDGRHDLKDRVLS